MRVRPLALVLALVILGGGGYVASVWAPDVPGETLHARWATPPSQFLTVKGLSLHLRDEGPREDSLPVVLVHGTSASLHTWDGWTDSLRATRRVIRFDLPGFGLTGPAPDGDYRMTTYVRTVLGVLDALGVRRAVIGGNSLGGGVAWHVAVAHPDRVAQLILVDAVGYPYVPESVPIGFRLARIPVLNVLIQSLLPRSLVEASVRNVMGDPARVTPALVDRYYDLTRREGNRTALVARFQQSVGDSDTAAIRTIRQPTLVLWGERDRLIPLRFAAQFGRDIAGSRVVTYPALGHVPQEEDPAATFAAVREFLTPAAPAAAPSIVR